MIRRITAWWRKRHRPAGPAPDWCCECMEYLHAGEVYEVRTGHMDADDGLGGTYLVQTFCRKHAPKGALHN